VICTACQTASKFIFWHTNDFKFISKISTKKQKKGLTEWNFGVHPAAWVPCFSYCAYRVTPTNASTLSFERFHFQTYLNIPWFFFVAVWEDHTRCWWATSLKVISKYLMIFLQATFQVMKADWLLVSLFASHCSCRDHNWLLISLFGSHCWCRHISRIKV